MSISIVMGFSFLDVIYEQSSWKFWKTEKFSVLSNFVQSQKKKNRPLHEIMWHCLGIVPSIKFPSMFKIILIPSQNSKSSWIYTQQKLTYWNQKMILTIRPNSFNFQRLNIATVSGSFSMNAINHRQCPTWFFRCFARRRTIIWWNFAAK